ncbi:DUF5684 domain-containing protein [Arenivirga flava]|uniref:FHA domain-containing protein n=1 Tax=Arenivirga flava TaxID=1930060 RepID=A0AA37UDG7_9MICO|nr:DUF5684 domain-containing protein [Arenivirga flava]GMA28533.1 hypothetical protein GCM10025874_17860 [Arenivirga flava]
MTNGYSSPGADPAAVLAIVVAVYGAAFLVGIAAYVLFAIGFAKILRKLGEPAWKGWVPYVNTATIIQLGGNPWWWLFVPFANLYFAIIGLHRITERFGRGAGTTVLGVLLPYVWALMLGAKGAQPVGGRASATLDDQGGRFAPGVVAPGAVPPPVVGGYGSTAPPPPPAPGQGPGAGFGQPSAVPGAAGSTPPPPPAPGARSFDAPPPPAQGSPFGAPPAPPAAVPSAPSSSTPPPPPAAANPFAPPAPAAQSGLIAPPPGIAPIPGVAAPAAPPAPPAAAPAWSAAPVPPPAPAAPAHAAAPVDDGDDDEVGATIVVDRKPRSQWHLVLADGGVLPVIDDIVVLGRKPLEGSGAQSLPVPDTTRTLSKTHAKLELLQGRWIVTDLNSTNGVIVVRADGTEELLDEGGSAEVLERFVLGEVELRLVKAGA